MSAQAERLDRPYAAWGVGVDGPRHLTIFQAEGLIADLKLAIKDARRLNDRDREV